MAVTSSVSFSGIAGIRAVRFPFGRGVVPSTACIYCVPQNITTGTGDLTLSYGGTSLVFPGMAVAAAHVSIRQDRRHPIMRVYVKDRRWQWAGKSISGDWNRRLSDGTVDTSTAKTPAELAALLLNALGEGSFDVSRMPTGVRPRCLWQNERADLALQRLCDYVACEVVLNNLTNRVEIWPAGSGNSPPEGSGEILPKYRFSPRAYVPSLVRVNCGYSTWQDRLLLQAAVRDYPSNQQRSLTATNINPEGWTDQYPGSFAGITNTNFRIRAFEDVWRTFRVIGRSNGSLGIANFPYPINSPNQYVLNDYVLETETDAYGVRHNLPAYSEVGEAYAYTALAKNTSNARSYVPFQLNKDRQIVEYNTPIFKLSTTGSYEQPTMYLVTSFQLKTADGQLGGLYRTGTVGGSGGELVLSRPELFSVYSNYPTPGNTEAQTIAEADAYVQLFVNKYSSQLAAEITYAGLHFGSLDGNQCQATWEWSVTKGPTTRVYEGDSPGDPLGPSPREQKRQLKLEALP